MSHQVIEVEKKISEMDSQINTLEGRDQNPTRRSDGKQQRDSPGRLA